MILGSQAKAERLEEQQDMTFSVTDEIVEEVVRRGYDPTFGARPMRRFNQRTLRQERRV